mmetsp:Transcript_3893/g.11245  ORF Transcript_3893/g.11245 Transcript_3893/m.11245 type:complete len:355 (+) Transcript_3893:849-1913(+)
MAVVLPVVVRVREGLRVEEHHEGHGEEEQYEEDDDDESRHVDDVLLQDHHQPSRELEAAEELRGSSEESQGRACEQALDVDVARGDLAAAQVQRDGRGGQQGGEQVGNVPGRRGVLQEARDDPGVDLETQDLPDLVDEHVEREEGEARRGEARGPVLVVGEGAADASGDERALPVRHGHGIPNEGGYVEHVHRRGDHVVEEEMAVPEAVDHGAHAGVVKGAREVDGCQGFEGALGREARQRHAQRTHLHAHARAPAAERALPLRLGQQGQRALLGEGAHAARWQLAHGPAQAVVDTAIVDAEVLVPHAVGEACDAVPELEEVVEVEQVPGAAQDGLHAAPEGGQGPGHAVVFDP